MLIGRLGQVLRRRWRVVVGGMLLTAALAGAVSFLRPPGYLVTATALVLPPSQAADGTDVNPYLQLGGLTSATDVLARALNDPTIHDRVIGQGVVGDFTAERDFLTSAPILLVTAEAPTVGQARAIRDKVLTVAPEVLNRLQADVGVPLTSRLSVETIAGDGTATVQYKSLVRLLLVTVAAGFALTVMAAGAVDSWAARRTRSRSPAPDEGPDASEGPVAASPTKEHSTGPEEDVARQRSNERPPRAEKARRGGESQADPDESAGVDPSQVVGAERGG